jgi:hypothetical protein
MAFTIFFAVEIEKWVLRIRQNKLKRFLRYWPESNPGYK